MRVIVINSFSITLLWDLDDLHVRCPKKLPSTWKCSISIQFSSAQSLSCVRLFVTPWTTARQAPLSITNSQSLPKLVHWVGDATQPSHPLSSPSPPALNLSQHQGLFKWVRSPTSGGQSIGVSSSIQVLEIVLKDRSHLFIFNQFYSLILFLAALGLRCCVQASSSCREQGLLFVEVCGLPTEVASLVCGARAPQLLHTSAVAWRHVESSRTHWQVREVHVL